VCPSCCFLHCYVYLRALHSFPTRRSSDLGNIQAVPFGAAGLKLQWLKKWFLHCVLKLRPLAPQVGWVWAVAAVFFIFYLLVAARSEEHTSELQSRFDLVCRLLLEKKKTTQ